MYQIRFEEASLSASRRRAFQTVRVLLFVAGYALYAAVGLPKHLQESGTSPSIGTEFLNHAINIGVSLLYPMSWVGGVLFLPVLVAVWVLSQAGVFRLYGGRPIRSQADVSAPGVWFSRNQFLIILAAPMLLALSLGFVLLAVMPATRDVKFFPLPFLSVGWIAFGEACFLTGCLRNLRVLAYMARLPARTRIADLKDGFQIETAESR